MKTHKVARIAIPSDSDSYADLSPARNQFLLTVILIVVWTVTAFVAGQGSTGKFCKNGWYKNMETGKLVKACVYTEEPMELEE